MSCLLGFSSKTIFLSFAFFVILFQLSGCSVEQSPRNEYQSVGYSFPASRTTPKLISVEEFAGRGITALHAYLPVGSQVDITNPVTHQQISAEVIGRTPKNKQSKLLISSEAARAISLHQYSETKMMMRVSRKTNYSTWPNRVQGKLATYVPSKNKVRDLFSSISIPKIPQIGSRQNEQSGSVVKVQHGKASYYANRFHGRKTASGERYNMNAMTCAHRTLPFGTRLKVTNKSNGRSVVLKVNDRGPYSKGRIIDVSLAAAKKLRMIKRGTASVKIEVLK